MKKEQKSARELADLVAQRIGMPDVRITVHDDPAYGWHATLYTSIHLAEQSGHCSERR